MGGRKLIRVKDGTSDISVPLSFMAEMRRKWSFRNACEANVVESGVLTRLEMMECCPELRELDPRIPPNQWVVVDLHRRLLETSPPALT